MKLTKPGLRCRKCAGNGSFIRLGVTGSERVTCGACYGDGLHKGSAARDKVNARVHELELALDAANRRTEDAIEYGRRHRGITAREVLDRMELGTTNPKKENNNEH